MSVEIFCRNLPSLPFGKNDRKWFPMWIRRYAGSLKRGKTDALSVDEPEVIRFLKALRDNGTPAWQRLQAARAVEAYRQHIVKKDQPSLVAIKQTLQRLAAKERNQVSGSSAAGQTTSDVVGPLPANEPEFVTRLRRELRRVGHQYDTEKAYVGWIKRFIKHCKSPQLDRFGETEIRSFLTALAVEGDVTFSTQKQAKCAPLFLYQHVLVASWNFWMRRGPQSRNGCLWCSAAKIIRTAAA